jgi:hypothetical protein
MGDDDYTFDEWADGISVRELIAAKNARIAELDAKVREWETWFDNLVRFDGDEPPERLKP